MENLRFTALKTTLHRKVLKVEPPKAKISEYYAEMTFNKKL